MHIMTYKLVNILKPNVKPLWLCHITFEIYVSEAIGWKGAKITGGWSRWKWLAVWRALRTAKQEAKRLSNDK